MILINRLQIKMEKVLSMLLQKRNFFVNLKAMAVFCCAVLLFSMIGPVYAARTHVEVIEPIWYIQGNPDLDAAAMPMLGDEHEYEESLEDAAIQLKAQLKDRKNYAVVYLRALDYGQETISDIFKFAVAHTGDPVEGDYIFHQYNGYRARLSGYTIGAVYYLTLEYFVEYFTTAEQEQELDVAVAKILQELDLDEATDYQKVKGAYDWLCQNVTYDFDNLYNDEYLLKHSAYAAIINRTAVCQGYATAMYRMLLELGVDARYIDGIGNGGPHGWNIVKLGGRYYNLDATWDAQRTQYNVPYAYFLKNDADFDDHLRDEEEYSFVGTKDYPMAANSFENEAFTVTFRDADGSVLAQDTYRFGQTIVAPKAPEKPSANGIRYTFMGWDQNVGVCEGDQTFIARYEETREEYHVYFKDENGTELSHQVYHYGDAIVAPQAPVKAADQTYTYTFSGWDTAVGTCTGDQTFTAVYTKEYIDYVVIFQYEDGTLIAKDTYHYGDQVKEPAQVDAPAGAEELVHMGWDSVVTKCFGDKVYIAVFAPAAGDGDLDGDNAVANSDVIYLLWHTLFPEKYHVNQNADYTKDGAVTNEDVIYLLWHTLFPESYPLK